jgi:hypothetical protein
MEMLSIRKKDKISYYLCSLYKNITMYKKKKAIAIKKAGENESLPFLKLTI